MPNDSRCATFCAAIAHIDNERWNGVPFFLKAGKGILELRCAQAAYVNNHQALNESKTEIIIQLKHSTNVNIFKDMVPNKLTIRVQPDEGVFLTVNTSVPSLTTSIEPMNLDLTYRDREIPEAYEALLLDALRGDYSRSVRGDELDASWKIFTPLLHHLDENDEEKPIEYPYGKSRQLQPLSGFESS